MPDLAALKTALEFDLRYKVPVENGSNSMLLALLAEDHPSETTFRTVTREQLLGAIGEDLQNIVGEELTRLRILTAGDSIDLSDMDVRTELQRIIPITAQTRLVGKAQRAKSYGEAVAGEPVTLRDLWKVLPQIPTSQAARYLNHEFGASSPGPGEPGYLGPGVSA